MIAQTPDLDISGYRRKKMLNDMLSLLKIEGTNAFSQKKKKKKKLDQNIFLITRIGSSSKTEQISI